MAFDEPACVLVPAGGVERAPDDDGIVSVDIAHRPGGLHRNVDAVGFQILAEHLGEADRATHLGSVDNENLHRDSSLPPTLSDPDHDRQGPKDPRFLDT